MTAKASCIWWACPHRVPAVSLQEIFLCTKVYSQFKGPSLVSTRLLRMGKPSWCAPSCLSSIPHTACVEFLSLHPSLWESRYHHQLMTKRAPAWMVLVHFHPVQNPWHSWKLLFLKILLWGTFLGGQLLKLSELASFQHGSACSPFPWGLLYVGEFETQYLPVFTS